MSSNCRKINCEIGFWDSFIESFPRYVSPLEGDINKMMSYANMFKFLLRSNIHMDISPEDAKKRIEEDDNFRILWKKSTEGVCGLEFDEQLPIEGKDIAKKELNSFFFVDDRDSTWQKIGQEYGVMIVDVNNIENLNYLFVDQGCSISKGSRDESWSSILQPVANHNFNSMVIIDPYIVKDTDTLRFEENIFAILDKLLPETLSVEFHLSIITRGKLDDGAKERFEEINEFIQSKKANLKITFTLYNDRKLFHDRAILTNYMIVESGAGFNLFNNKFEAINNTSIRIAYGDFQNTMNPLKDTYYDNLKIVKKNHDILIPGKNYPQITQCWGSGTMNRLLE